MFINVLLTFLLIALTSCNKPENSVLVIADSGKIDKESANELTLPESVIGDLLYTPFFKDDNNFVFHNLLAEDVRMLPGGKTIEIKIRKGVRFHDGRELTESDVAASIGRITDTDAHIKERYGQLKVTIAGKLKVTVTGDKPLSDVYTLLLPNIYIYSKELIGTGPYKFHRWINNGIELIVNNDYFEGTPKLKKVIYRYEPEERNRVNMLLKGEADLLIWLSPKMAEFLKTDDRFYVNEWPTGFYSALFLNNESPLFRDKAIRRAVSMAIDRDVLIQKVLKGGGTKILTPFASLIFKSEKNKTGIDYRPKEAVRRLKEAGWEDADGDGILEKDGRELRFRLFYNRKVKEFKQIADIISQNLFETGIGVEAIPANMDESTDRNFIGGSYDAILEVKSSYDSVNMLAWSSSSIFNISRFNSREMDNHLERLKEVTDIEQKKEIYGRMLKIFEDDTPAVFLYTPVIFTAVNKKFNGAEDFVGSVYSIYKIKDWSLNEDIR